MKLVLNVSPELARELAEWAEERGSPIFSGLSNHSDWRGLVEQIDVQLAAAQDTSSETVRDIDWEARRSAEERMRSRDRRLHENESKDSN